MNCEICQKPLRADNKIGVCRAHRAQSNARKEYMEKYASDKFGTISEYKKSWSSQNRTKLNDQGRLRRQRDPQAKLAHAIRVRLNRAIKTDRRTTELLGCTIPELRVYLESQFQPGMTWANHGEWHIDHIIGLANWDLTNQEDLAKACHYSNLRPLWAEENLRRKKRNIISPRVPDTLNGDDVR